MGVCRRSPPSSSASAAARTRWFASATTAAGVQASDALRLPSRRINLLFSGLFAPSLIILMQRWREMVRLSAPLRVVCLAEMFAIIALVASLIYVISVFGITFVQSMVFSKDEEDFLLSPDIAVPASSPSPSSVPCSLLCSTDASALADSKLPEATADDEEIIASVVAGKTPSYTLESKLGDCRRAAGIRREVLRRTTGRSLEGLPLDGFDYASILGQCCELAVGYVQVPVGIAGPLLLDGRQFYVPMATTEGCLVASTNRGCKAIAESGGATSVVVRDAMARAPVVSLPSAKRAAELKAFLEDPTHFDAISRMFNKSSRFARLSGVQCALAGKNLYMRLSCSTGDAMGMNMVSNGTQNVLDYLQTVFPDINVASISGNLCSDKKAAAVNWIQGRGKSIVCEVVITEQVVNKVLKTSVAALVELNVISVQTRKPVNWIEGRGKSIVCEVVITEQVVNKVLKTSVAALVELNVVKNLAGSAVAGALGGFNAHASNLVTAVFIATGQDPAQNVESCHCITMMEAVNGGKDLHVSVTMPSIEVGTVGGGTQLASQAACLDLLGVRGASEESPGANARLLATIVAGAVLAGELSLMSALAAGQLVSSHMKYNRSSKDFPKAVP